MHGDGGRSRGSVGAGAGAVTAPFAVASACVELWGCLAYSSNACWLIAPIETRTWRSKAMNLLNNHRYTLIAGIVVAVVLALLIGGPQFNQLGLARWFHIVAGVFWIRSEEHTSELQSHVNLVCRLLLEKKKNTYFDAATT